MNSQLTWDTLTILQAELSPIAGIRLQLSPAEENNIFSVLERHPLDYRRKLHILGLFIIVTRAMQRHLESPANHQELIRSILDGDYLHSFYLQFAMKTGELDLVAHLAPAIKRIQIRRAAGDYTKEDFAAHIDQYLTREARQDSRTSKAI
ncbi:hypothetical protein ACE6ED_16800 [Paenibacillus sp. CN-4]|uniref:hypothetical protein n=1 Tax=Paenibacillus nanchangensis TaxID=3348343 RepID=UPI003979CD9E